MPSGLHRTYGAHYLHFITCRPKQWRWSSYRFYFQDEDGPVRINEGWAKISFQAPAT